MPEPVIIDAVRTPFGKRGGMLKDVRPDQLLADALTGLVNRVGISPAKIEDVICGTVTQIDEQGANIGRLGTLLAGFPVQVPAVSLNRMCGSSQQAVHFAAQAVAAGDINYAIGGGVESMTHVPMASDIGGSYDKVNPELRSRYQLLHQGESAERVAAKWGISRTDVDSFAIESHRRAAKAVSEGRNTELLPLGNKRDEGIRDAVDPVKMAALATVFRPNGDGVVTAGNSSQISDGAAAVLVANREVAVADGLRPKARFRARVVTGDDPSLQLTAVMPATRMALQRAGVTIQDVDWIEINEAFATIVLAWAREFRPDMNKVNPWGGAIAHGHPLGATGAGLMAKMLAGLQATGGALGLQVMCIGHGMSTATVIERL